MLLLKLDLQIMMTIQKTKDLKFHSPKYLNLETIPLMKIDLYGQVKNTEMII